MTVSANVGQEHRGWTADASTFGARLALVRQRLGWNVAEAAKACAIPIESWRRWERDGREPHRITTIAKKISAATGCDYHWLVLGPEVWGGPSTTRDQGGQPTHEYDREGRLLGAIGDERTRRGSVRRPVRRTKPLATRKPFTPTAA